jgi:lipopolysaccharide/colanic/teichoic acid biosynthesis glycosyltransferase
MLSALFLRSAQRAWPPDPAGGASTLHAAPRMQALLARERARTDRTGDPLSMVTFTPRTAAARAATVALLAQLLPTRLRCTDDAGWLDDERIAALLPGTTPDGAWKVADDVCVAFPETLPPPVCTVYTYPTAAAGAEPEPAGAAPQAQRAIPLDLFFLRPFPFWKRLLDIVGAIAGLILFTPLLALIAVAIKLTSPGPVLFTQWRSGRGGRPFRIYKFRTMAVDAEAHKAALRPRSEQDGPAFKMAHDPRVTRLGRLLRKTSLDELPQFWNVLLGDMSLVGPRPLPCDEANACRPWQRRRLDITPGLTCIWQVRGRSRVTFEEWVRMDLQYIHAQSLVCDLVLIVLTVPAVLSRRGAQ